MRWKTAPRLLVGTALLVCCLTGCRASSQDGTEPAAAGPTTPPEAAPTEPDPTPTYPPPDLSARPQIWFSPLDPTPPDASRPFSGSQFFDLFAYPEQWQEAASRTHVFKLYGGWVAWKASLDDLKQVVDFAKQHGLALAFEAGPLIPTDECTGEIEGFAGPSEAARIVEKVKTAGGTIVYVDLEHPYDAATFYDAPQACRMEPEEIAHNISAFIAAVREVFPEAKFGAVETAQHDLQHIASWVEAYRAVQGEDLAYFHLDLNYGDPAWAEEALLIESYLKEQGIEFGIFYRGEWGDATSTDWIARAEETIIDYEVRQGGRPDQVIFQSWHPQPEQLLPETDPGAFTYLINRYYRERTTIHLEAADGGSGLLLQGKLQGSSTGPLTGEIIQINLAPAAGEGFLYEYRLEGIVPLEATEADVGYRVNLECDCNGSAEITLVDIRYQEGGAEGNPIPNHDFSRGYAGWGAWGNGEWRLVRDPQTGGLNHVLSVTPEQNAAINSGKFPVAAGSPFTISFLARVSPGSSGSGYFNIIFNNSYQEVRRFTLPIQPARIPAGEAVTDEKGEFVIELPQVGPDQVVVQAWYPGSGTFWPAQMEVVYPAD